MQIKQLDITKVNAGAAASREFNLTSDNNVNQNMNLIDPFCGTEGGT